MEKNNPNKFVEELRASKFSGALFYKKYSQKQTHQEALNALKQLNGLEVSLVVIHLKYYENEEPIPQNQKLNLKECINTCVKRFHLQSTIEHIQKMEKQSQSEEIQQKYQERYSVYEFFQCCLPYIPSFKKIIYQQIGMKQIKVDDSIECDQETKDEDQDQYSGNFKLI